MQAYASQHKLNGSATKPFQKEEREVNGAAWRTAEG